jgi:hypothetical protein
MLVMLPAMLEAVEVNLAVCMRVCVCVSGGMYVCMCVCALGMLPAMLEAVQVILAVCLYVCMCCVCVCMFVCVSI